MTSPLVKRLCSWAGPASSRTDAALEEALDMHWSSICQTLYYLLGDWEEAQDLALETFWRLHTRAPQQLRDPTSVAGWLYRVATNLGFNAIRARRRRRLYEKAAGALRLQISEPIDPEKEVERRQLRERVRYVLAHMRRRKAQLLLLRYTDHTYAEIADILGIAAGSVGTLLVRAEKDFERRYRALEDVL